MSASKENVVRDSADNKQTPAVTNPGNNPNGFYTMAKDNFEAVNLNEEEDNTDSNNNNPEMENTESTKQTGKGCFKFCSLL